MRLEVLYSGDHNLSCFYMAEVVKVVAPTFKDRLDWDIVYVFKKDGARRFYDLSVSLYGDENVRKNHCVAPVPSIFIDGRLVFDRIPMTEELEQAINGLIKKKDGCEP